MEEMEASFLWHAPEESSQMRKNQHIFAADVAFSAPHSIYRARAIKLLMYISNFNGILYSNIHDKESVESKISVTISRSLSIAYLISSFQIFLTKQEN